MKQKYHVVASLMALTIAMLWTGPGQGQSTTSAPFQIVEATIDDIHMASRSGHSRCHHGASHSVALPNCQSST
jgi:hypothetical protein